MFTGLVEEIGTIRQMERTSAQALTMRIQAKTILEDICLGDSIAVNGVCVTVTQFGSGWFETDVMPETVKSTSLGTLRVGEPVNLERALAAGGRFGGHFVSGHVDCTGTILERTPRENAVYYVIKVPAAFSPFMMQKGSITVEGTSLTLFKADSDTFTISLIPHTAQQTILGDKKPGDVVNVEFDMIAKHICHLLNLNHNPAPKKNHMRNLLIENGFA